jgi:hypothetical protein
MAGVRRPNGALGAVQVPLTPQSRGIICEAPPFLNVFEKDPGQSAYPGSPHAIIEGKRSRCFDIIDSRSRGYMDLHFRRAMISGMLDLDSEYGSESLF